MDESKYAIWDRLKNPWLYKQITDDYSLAMVVNYTRQTDTIPDSLTKYVTRVAEKLILKKQFCNYSLADDMVQEGITQMLMACTRYKAAICITTSYLVVVCNSAFIRAISLENKQQNIKKLLLND